MGTDPGKIVIPEDAEDMRVIVTGLAIVPDFLADLAAERGGVGIGVIHGLRPGPHHAVHQVLPVAAVHLGLQRVIAGVVGIGVIVDIAVADIGPEELRGQHSVLIGCVAAAGQVIGAQRRAVEVDPGLQMARQGAHVGHVHHGAHADIALHIEAVIVGHRCLILYVEALNGAGEGQSFGAQQTAEIGVVNRGVILNRLRVFDAVGIIVGFVHVVEDTAAGAYHGLAVAEWIPGDAEARCGLDAAVIAQALRIVVARPAIHDPVIVPGHLWNDGANRNRRISQLTDRVVSHACGAH